MTEPFVGSVPYFLAGRFYRLSYRAFGDRKAPRVVCVHGLTRNARDFDVLARALSDRFHVVSVDLPGRGQSDWLDDAALYVTSTYINALSHLFASLDGTIDFLGTSLGGICGMEIAAAGQQPIRRLILNDVGAYVPKQALLRIRDYLAAPAPRFPDHNALKLYLRRVHAPFGPLTDAQWLQLARDSARALPDGSVALHYDPKIAVTYAANPGHDLDMWHWWNAITIPTMTLRGESSDILPEIVLAEMARKTTPVVVPQTGHAPALLDEVSIHAIREFLLQ